MVNATGWTLAAAMSGVFAVSVAAPLAPEPRAEHTRGLAEKKVVAAVLPVSDGPILATLADTHSPERVPLDDAWPDGDRFDALLADRVTGSREHLDPRLLDLLRGLGRAHGAPRIELVSGFRSPKLNEMLRKKGHHVASHSQHSLGHAVDFRVVLVDGGDALSPLALEAEIRASGWAGGTGVYLGKTDRFIHADVGPRRRWDGQ